jgi:hypothetical protein
VLSFGRLVFISKGSALGARHRLIHKILTTKLPRYQETNKILLKLMVIQEPDNGRVHFQRFFDWHEMASVSDVGADSIGDAPFQKLAVVGRRELVVLG